MSSPESTVTNHQVDAIISLQDIINDVSSEPISMNQKPEGILRTTYIEGDYELQGFFTHNDFVDLDDDGNTFVLENFDSMKGKASSAIGTQFFMDSSEPQTWPSLVDTYFPLTEDVSPFRNSSMFTPVFFESTNIAGKIHVLSHINTQYFEPVDFTIRVRVFIFNPSTEISTEIASVEEILPDGLLISNQQIFDLTLNNTYLIPAGNRLKLTFEGKVNDLSASAEVSLSTSDKGSGQYSWNIVDGVYSNSYSFGTYDQVLGMQIQYKSATFPDIVVSGISNSTLYYEEQEVFIDVSGAISSSYRWDLESYVSFSNSTSTFLPTIDGWHYLEVRASDSFNNTAIEIYDIGYDSTESSLTLNNPTNNSIILAGSFLNFSTYGANELTYEWDNNGTIFDLLSIPEYNVLTPSIEGYHNLSVILNDTCVYDEYFYIFGIDSSAPQISLLSLTNDTLQASGKLLEVEITDFSPDLTINYKWDDNIFLPWLPSEGSIYRTYIPETEGYHNLTITAEDSLGCISNRFYRFNVSSETLLIELRTMVNESWYLGGETVEVTISGTNDTILFSWNDTPLQDGNPFMFGGTILTLSGINSLPNDIERYHYLKIVVGGIDNFEYMYIFEFRIDNENPIIDSSFLDLTDQRFKSGDTFTFILYDNATQIADLIVQISIDGESNITLSFPFELHLSIFTDGIHNITIYVSDIAGNIVTEFISFYIDSTAPDIEIIYFEGLVSLPNSSLYAPSGSTIEISIDDADPSYTATYSWKGGEYQSFNETIILNYDDDFGILIINASDSLGNEEIIVYELTLDSLAPTVSLVFPYEHSKINEHTSLIFNTEDISQQTISHLDFHWDIYPSYTPEIFPDSKGDFDLALLPLYTTGEYATLSIYAVDIVGNNQTYYFVFEVDLTPPDSTLFIFDEETGEYHDALDYDYIKVGEEIWYNISTSPDLSTFIYYWNSEAGEILDSPWIIHAPTEVGSHNLTVILRDSTGESTSPNEIELTITFLVKDEGYLTILETSDHHCYYGEDAIIELNLKNTSMVNLEINEVNISGSILDILHISDFNYRVFFPTNLLVSKGNYSLYICVESSYYFGQTNESYMFEIEILPIPLAMELSVSDTEIVQGSSVVISGILSYLNGTPIAGVEITFLIYIYYKSDQGSANAAIEGYDEIISLSDITGVTGEASVDYILTKEIEQIAVSATFEGSSILDGIFQEFSEIITTIKAGLSPVILYSIVGVSVFLLGLVAFIVYKATKRKPFEKYLDKVSTNDLVLKINEICPGVILSIFDQRKGPVPLISDHSFDYDYGGRLSVGTENFLLKICDQAYSTLGFEDVHQGRKTSAVNLPNEGLVGFVHAIQLENKDSRGGLENLSVILLTQADYGNCLLAYSDFIYDHIDDLVSKLNSKKGLEEIRSQIEEIRLRTTQVILAGIEDSK